MNVCLYTWSKKQICIFETWPGLPACLELYCVSLFLRFFPLLLLLVLLLHYRFKLAPAELLVPITDWLTLRGCISESLGCYLLLVLLCYRCIHTHTLNDIRWSWKGAWKDRRTARLTNKQTDMFSQTETFTIQEPRKSLDQRFWTANNSSTIGLWGSTTVKLSVRRTTDGPTIDRTWPRAKMFYYLLLLHM